MTSQIYPALHTQATLFPPEVFALASEHFLQAPSAYAQKKVLVHLHSWEVKITPSPPSATTEGQTKHSCAKVTIEFLAVHVQDGTPFVDIE